LFPAQTAEGAALFIFLNRFVETEPPEKITSAPAIAAPVESVTTPVTCRAGAP